MNYWLLKSEPGKFSIDDLGASRAKTTCWDGVRNYQARNFMRKGMARGDLAFFYHSNCEEPGIAGIVEIVREAYPDDTAHDAGHEHYDPKSDAANPRWWMVDVRLVRKLKRLITLKELRNHADSALDNFLLLRRGNRLSVIPVTRRHWNFINKLE